MEGGGLAKCEPPFGDWRTHEPQSEEEEEKEKEKEEPHHQKNSFWCGPGWAGVHPTSPPSKPSSKYSMIND